MANEYTRVADTIVPEIVNPEVSFRINEKSAFMQSGALYRDPVADKFASDNFGKILDTPRYLHIEDSESNVGTDDPTQNAESNKNRQVSIKSYKQFRNKIWGEMDLVSALSKPDPNQVVAQQVGDYWAQEYDKIAIASTVGVYNDNIANNSGDMVNDISIDTVDPLDPSNLINSIAIIDAQATLGDNQHDLSIMIVHSIVYAQMRKNNEIDFIQDSDQKTKIPFYQGARVIVSDRQKTILGANKVKYVTTLIGTNAIRWGEGSPKVPMEINRNPKAGNGEGAEEMIYRRHFIISPTNYSFESASVASTSPTLAELELAANWSRGDVERKDVKIAFLITNG